MTWDLQLTDCRAATMDGAGYGAIEDAAIAISGDHVAWIGPRADLPKKATKETVSLGGRWVTPGLVECHTHLVFGGDRARRARADAGARPALVVAGPRVDRFRR